MNKNNKVKVGFLLGSLLLTLTNLLSTAEEIQVVNNLLPKGSIIHETVISSKVDIETYFKGEHFKSVHVRTGKCIVKTDLNNDGKDELIILYKMIDKEQKGFSEYNYFLNVFSWEENKWNLIYDREYRSPGYVDPFYIDDLLNDGTKQIIVGMGIGASLGGGYSVVGWQGGTFRELVKDSPNVWNVYFDDIDKDGYKDIFGYARYETLPNVYTWNKTAKYFENYVENKEFSKRYYQWLISIINSPHDEKGNYNAKFAFILFQAYDYLGEQQKAVAMGKQLAELARKNPQCLPADSYMIIYDRFIKSEIKDNQNPLNIKIKK